MDLPVASFSNPALWVCAALTVVVEHCNALYHYFRLLSMCCSTYESGPQTFGMAALTPRFSGSHTARHRGIVGRRAAESARRPVQYHRPARQGQIFWGLYWVGIRAGSIVGSRRHITRRGSSRIILLNFLLRIIDIHEQRSVETTFVLHSSFIWSPHLWQRRQYRLSSNPVEP
jgi:hypothetical protein